jgi:hypothetical protein
LKPISILKYYNLQLFLFFTLGSTQAELLFLFANIYNREYYDNMEVLGLERSFEKMSDEEDQYDRSLSKN